VLQVVPAFIYIERLYGSSYEKLSLFLNSD
jgi:hypothetical protein